MEEFAILYRHNKCSKLSASKIILSETEVLDKEYYIILKSKSTKKYCNRCMRYILDNELIDNTLKDSVYFIPAYCELKKVYKYTARDIGLYDVTKK